MTIYIKSYSKYAAALYTGCWSCTNYGATRATPAVRLSPAMSATAQIASDADVEAYSLILL